MSYSTNDILRDLLRDNRFEDKLRVIVEEFITDNQQGDQRISDTCDSDTDETHWWSPIKNILESTFSDKDKKIKELLKNADDDRTRIDELKQTKSSLNRDLDNKKEEVERLNEVKDKQAENIKDLNSKLEIAQKEAGDLRKELKEKEENLNKQIEVLQGNKNQLQNKVSKLEDNNKQLNEKLEEVEKEKNRFKEKLDKYESDKNLKEHRKLFEEFQHTDDVKVKNEFDDFESFVLNSGRIDFLKNAYNKFRTIKQKDSKIDLKDLFKLYINSVKKVEKSKEIEIVEPEIDEIFKAREQESIEGKKNKTKKILIPGFKINGEMKKAIVETY